MNERRHQLVWRSQIVPRATSQGLVNNDEGPVREYKLDPPGITIKIRNLNTHSHSSIAMTRRHSFGEPVGRMDSSLRGRVAPS